MPRTTWRIGAAVTATALLMSAASAASAAQDEQARTPQRHSAVAAQSATSGQRRVMSVAKPVFRVAGADRVETAIAASQDLFGPASSSDKAGAVVLSRMDSFADALAGVPLAAQADAPLLLTGSKALDARVEAEITRILPVGGTVYLLGSSAVLDNGVATRLTGLGFQVKRLAGTDRYLTAIKVAEEVNRLVGGTGARVALLTTGNNFPDGVAAGAAAGWNDGILLLSNDSKLPTSVASYLKAHASLQVVTAGKQAAAAYPSAEAELAGNDRYETAAMVAEAFFDAEPVPATGTSPADPALPEYFNLASGATFPDALSGGAHAALTGAPILLTAPQRLSTGTKLYLSQRRSQLQFGTLFGSTGAVSDSVRVAAEAAIK